MKKRAVVYVFGALLAVSVSILTYWLLVKDEMLARDILSKELKDPGSAVFRDLHWTADGERLCGQVNARNGYGAYTGYKKFVVIPYSSPATSMLGIEADDEEDEDVRYRAWGDKC